MNTVELGKLFFIVEPLPPGAVATWGDKPVPHGCLEVYNEKVEKDKIGKDPGL